MIDLDTALSIFLGAFFLGVLIAVLFLRSKKR